MKLLMSYIIFLDAGHGGHDPGATAFGYREKDIALEITMLLGKVLERLGFTVVYCRTTDEFISLRNRSIKSNNANATLFISLHLNSFSNPNAKGLEVFHYPNSANGRRLATTLYNSLVKSGLYTAKRGVKTANFAVLRGTVAPAALVELGFISNREDLNLILANKNEFAEALAEGVCNYLGVAYESPKKEDEYELRDLEIDIIGKKRNFTSLFKDGENYVPLRLIAETLGFEVKHDNETKEISIGFRQEPVEIDGKDTTITSNKVNGDTNMVGMRELAEKLNVDIEWDEVDKKVIINTKEG